MNEKMWQKRIKNACELAGTYEPQYDITINALAKILERRDEAEAAYREASEGMVVEHTNKGGATNLTQNPIIRLINDLNRDALAYLKELCLTPKSIREDAKKPVKEPSALEKALANLAK